MQVLITTSPLAWVPCPPRSPKTVNPSSRTRTIGSDMLHHALRHHLTATDGHDDPSAQPAARKWRVLTAALEGRRVNRPLVVRIDEDPLIVQGLADDLSWARHASAVHGAIRKAESEDDAHRRLEAVEAVRARLLGGLVVGRMIGCDRVDHALDQRLTQCVTIVWRPQRRIDIPVRAQRRRIP